MDNPSHKDIYTTLGRVEAKVDMLIGVEERTRSLEASRNVQRGVMSAVTLTLAAVLSKLMNLF